MALQKDFKCTLKRAQDLEEIVPNPRIDKFSFFNGTSHFLPHKRIIPENNLLAQGYKSFLQFVLGLMCSWGLDMFFKTYLRVLYILHMY